MPYLIDGNNLIGHLPYLELFDPESRHRLAAQLSVFQRVKRTKIILVFDGAPDPELGSEKSNRKKFLVFFPQKDQTADMFIKEWIEKQTDLKHLYVVSSDGEIKKFARTKGAKVIDCREFARQLKSTLKKYKRSKDAKKVEKRLTPLEVDHWLDIFSKTDE